MPFITFVQVCSVKIIFSFSQFSRLVLMKSSDDANIRKRWCHERVNVSEEGSFLESINILCKFQAPISVFFVFLPPWTQHQHLMCRNLFSQNLFSCRNKFIHHRVSIFCSFSHEVFVMTLSGAENPREHCSSFNRLVIEVGKIHCLVTAWFRSENELIRFSCVFWASPDIKTDSKPTKQQTVSLFPSHSPGFFTFSSHLFHIIVGELLDRILEYKTWIFNGKEFKRLKAEFEWKAKLS